MQLGTSTSTGIGTLVLAGTNGYTGGTFLGDGTLSIDSANAIGSPATLTFAGSETLQAGGTFSLGKEIIVNSGAIPTFDTNGQTMTLSGPIIGSPTTAIPSLSVIDSLGNGLLDIAASETLDEVTVGTDMVSGGTLDVGPGGRLNLVASGAGLDDGLGAGLNIGVISSDTSVLSDSSTVKLGTGTINLGTGTAFAAKATRQANLTGGLPARASLTSMRAPSSSRGRRTTTPAGLTSHPITQTTPITSTKTAPCSWKWTKSCTPPPRWAAGP